MKRYLYTAAVALGLVGAQAQAAVHELRAILNGSNEVTNAGVPNQGDPDGIGLAILRVDDSGALPTVDWLITADNIVIPLTGAHIHQGAAGVNGSVVVNFSASLIGTDLADADLVNVLQNPSGWYVNLHNLAFSNGAIRGQLFLVPEPGTWALMAAGLGVLLWLRRRVG